MKPLTLEETGLKEELKRQYYEKEKLGIKNSRENFEMLCHLEDFEIQYWELQKENKQLKIQISAREEICNRLENNWNKLKQIIDVKMYNSEYLINLCGYKVDVDTLEILKIIKEEMQELEQGSDK